MTWELEWMAALPRGRWPVVDGLMVAVTVLAPLLCLAAPAGLWRSGRRRAALVLLAALLGALALSLELQYILLRPRPSLAGPLPKIPTPAFPSGHAALCGALATFWSFAGRRREAALAWAFAALVMVSRVWLGHHHPTDVAVGGVVGACVAALLYGGYLADDPRPRWAWWIWPQLGVVVLASSAAYLGLSDFAWLTVRGADKALHLLLFGLLSFFVVGWLARLRPSLVIAGLACVSTADELLQALSPARTFDLGDLACTLTGVLAGGWAATALLRRALAQHRTTSAEAARA